MGEDKSNILDLDYIFGILCDLNVLKSLAKNEATFLSYYCYNSFYFFAIRVRW